MAKTKAGYDTSAWNGNASRWSSAEAYCADCLIDMNPSGQEKSKDKCKLPYRSPGSDKVNVNALRAMASGARGLSALKGVPRPMVRKAANFMIRHWPKAFGKTAPPNIYRMAGKEAPADSRETMAQFFKDKSGQWWGLLVYSNRWMDREQSILSEAAHQDYADWIDKTGFRPQVTVLHLPRMEGSFWPKVFHFFGSNVGWLNKFVRWVYRDLSLGEVIRVIPMNGFSVAVARMYPEQEDRVKILAAQDDNGLSHGFIVLDEEDFNSESGPLNIVNGYRSFEISILPRVWAANVMTAPLFARGENVMAMTDEQREWLKGILPANLVEDLEERTKDNQDMLDKILAFKDMVADPAPASEEEKAVPAAPIAAEKADHAHEMPMNGDEEDEEDEEDEDTKEKEKSDSKATDQTAEIVKQVMVSLNASQLKDVVGELRTAVTTLQETVTALVADNAQLAEQVKVLKQDSDTQIASLLTPIQWSGVGYSPTQDPKTAVPEDKAAEVKDALPRGANGLSDEEKNNPMNFGFFDQLKELGLAR